MPKVYPDRLDALVAIGEGQDGYITTQQARDAGLSLQTLVGFEHAGHLEREQYALYRLARWPSSKRPGLWRAFLWATRADPNAAFSHRTALDLHGVSDINPSKIDVTFTLDVRVRSTKPPAVVARRRNLPKNHVESQDGLRVTTLYRTLLDLITDRMALAVVEDILDRGKFVDLSPGELAQLRAVFVLSEETKTYLKHTLQFPRHLTETR